MKTKKLLSLLLSVAMICTMFTALGISVSAAEPQIFDIATGTDFVNTLNQDISDMVINITKDFEYVEIYLEGTKNITINLNGHTIAGQLVTNLQKTGTINITINGKGTLKGSLGQYACYLSTNTTLVAKDVRFIGGDGSGEKPQGGYGLFLAECKEVRLNNCYISSGNSTGTARNLAAIHIHKGKLYIKDCTLIRTNTGTGTNYKVISGLINEIFDYDTETAITIPNNDISPMVFGKGYREVATIENTNTPVTATTTIPAPTYTVTIPETISFGSVKGALEKYRNETTDQLGNAVTVSKNFKVTANGVKNLFNDLDDGKNDYINVTITFNSILEGTKNTANTVPYSLSQADTKLVTGGKIATFYNDVDLESKGKVNTAIATITMNRCDIKNADSYKGTVTFNIAVAER